MDFVNKKSKFKVLHWTETAVVRNNPSVCYILKSKETANLHLINIYI